NPIPDGQAARTPVTQVATFDGEFRSGLGYNQPASALASVGVMAAGSGDTASKYVARRETPLYIAENCTQCMECIAVCPDTALPQILRTVTNEVDGFSVDAKRQFFDIIDKVPMAYQKANAIFATPEKRSAGGGGIFSIFVSDLCKGCAACVTACGEHQALRMVQETEDVNAEHESGTAFLDLLPDTPQKYLGLYNDLRPQDSKTATLRNMLMVRRNYDAMISGYGPEA